MFVIYVTQDLYLNYTKSSQNSVRKLSYLIMKWAKEIDSHSKKEERWMANEILKDVQTSF